jgi:sortase B
MKKQPNEKGFHFKDLDRRVLMGICIVCFAIAAAALIYLIYYGVGIARSNQEYESMRQEVISIAETIPSKELIPEPEKQVPSTTETTEETEETPSTEQPVLEEGMSRTIDFTYLTTQENEDIYAWIYIPDTNIDYPVLQHPTDDSRYLNYNVDGSKGYPGCIYTERINDKDFSDFNTLLYGHNMKNGSMFHDLHNYADEVFLEEHPYVYIYLPDRTLKYQIFAAHRYDDRHIMYSFDFTSDVVRTAYLDEIFSTSQLNAVIDKDVTVGSDDHIITMSTCVSGTDYRYLVQAVLVEELDINE